MADYPIEKCNEPDDPDRCQALLAAGHGQCNNKRLPNSKYCAVHGGNIGEEQARKESLNNYRLTKFNSRLQQLGSSPNIKSLRDEIAILRLMMEERLNQCSSAHDLIMQSHTISDLVLKIDKVVTSCHKLELNMGALLDKQDIILFGTELINIISSEIDDEELLASLANKITEAVARATSIEDE